MSARQNFYSNVFEQIRGYKNKELDQPTKKGFLNDHIIQLSLAGSVITVVVFGGYLLSYPKLLTFSRPQLATFITEQKFNARRLFSPDRSFASDGSVTFNGLPVKTVDDGYIDAETADRSYGAETILRVNNSPERASFLKFKIPEGITVAKASLYVTTDGSLPSDVDVTYVSDNLWSGKLLTYSSRPMLGGEKAGTMIAAGENQLSLDVTKYLKPGQIVSFALTKTNTDEAVFASSESGSGVGPVIIISQ